MKLLRSSRCTRDIFFRLIRARESVKMAWKTFHVAVETVEIPREDRLSERFPTYLFPRNFQPRIRLPRTEIENILEIYFARNQFDRIHTFVYRIFRKHCVNEMFR